MPTFSLPLQVISLDGDGYHLLVEIKLFGETHMAVVDTGASRSVFERTLILAHAGDVEHVPANQASTLFAVAETIQATIPLLKIGRLKLSNYDAVAIDLSSVTTTYAQFGHPAIAAIIGGDILMEHHAKIDYVKKTLRFTNPAKK